MSDLPTRMRSRASIEVGRLRVEQAERQIAFENARTALHRTNAGLAKWRAEEARWVDRCVKDSLPRIPRRAAP